MSDGLWMWSLPPDDEAPAAQQCGRSDDPADALFALWAALEKAAAPYGWLYEPVQQVALRYERLAPGIYRSLPCE